MTTTTNVNLLSAGAVPVRRPAVSKKNRERLGQLGGGVVSILVLAAVWEIVAYFQPPFVFPPLSAVFRDIASFAESGALLEATVTTTRSVALGALLSLAGGVILGFGFAKFTSVFGPFLNFVQTVPYVVWALVSLIWFGLTGAAVVFTIFVAAFPIISFNVAEGLRNVDGHLLGMAKSVKASRFMILRHIVMPSLTPYLTSSTRTMVGMCWKMSVLAELFAGGGAGRGVGYNLFVGWEFSRTSEVFAWTVWLVVLMMATDLLILKPVESIVNRWKSDRK
jgi:ABC-type nitrate/sulfonate/bicarbonate transport system permease component